MARPATGRTRPATTPAATTVTESRMLDLIKNGRVSRALAAVGESSGHLRLLESCVISPACGAQLWQLTRAHHAVVWVEKSRDGVTVHTEHASAADEFFRITADLAARQKPKPAAKTRSRKARPSGDTK